VAIKLAEFFNHKGGKFTFNSSQTQNKLRQTFPVFLSQITGGQFGNYKYSFFMFLTVHLDMCV
jgi:hypothetical protein